MTTLLHIVHPYTYKLSQDLTLVIGNDEHNLERNKAAGEFTAKASERKTPTLLHNSSLPWTIEDIMERGAIAMDEDLRVILDSDFPCVITPKTGQPVPDTKPEKVKQENWDGYWRHYTNRTAFAQAIGTPEVQLFIGGAIESCVASCIDYIYQHLKTPNQRLCVVKELCATFKPDELERVERDFFKKYGIELLTIPDALQLL